MTLHIKAYLHKATFDAAAAKIGLHSAYAFWDPRNNAIGFYFDGSILRWYRERATLTGQPELMAARRVRDFVLRESFASIAHEIVHFLQHANHNFLGDRPFLAESAALIFEANLAAREEFARVEQEGRMRGGNQLPAADSPCAALMQLSPKIYSQSLMRLQRGIDAARHGVDIGKVVAMDSVQFYRQPRGDLESQYDAALAFALFVETLPRERFKLDLQPLIQERNFHAPDDRMRALSTDFRNWAEEWAENWWADKKADSHFEDIDRLTTWCVARRQYLAALMGSSEMIELKPHSATGLIYAGDVYYKVDAPFIALDYYGLANQVHDESKDDTEPVIRIKSRLGDAFEELGDIDSALDAYRKIANLEQAEVQPEFAVTWLRTKLAFAFYTAAVAGGYAHDDRARFLLNSYVGQMQGTGMDCAATSDTQRVQEAQAAFGRSDIQAYWRLLTTQYDDVARLMRANQARPDLTAVIAARDSFCNARK